MAFVYSLTSLTGLACLAGLAFVIRMLRKHEPENEAEDSSAQQKRRYGSLSFSSLSALVDWQALPYYIIDLRDQPAIRRHPLPDLLKKGLGPCLEMPSREMRRYLFRRESGEFALRYPDIAFPSKEALLVFVSDNVDQSKKGVEEAQAIGFMSSVYLDDSIAAIRQKPCPGPEVQFLSRDAVGVLLKMADNFSPVEATIIDVRRPDEHVIFGSIEGMKNLPASELPRALKMDEEEFGEKYQFKKPDLDDVIVFSCRTNKRARWASHLCTELGFKRVFVHEAGVFGWQLSTNVKKYEAYDKGQPIPKPISFKKEKLNRHAGVRELISAGLTSS